MAQHHLAIPAPAPYCKYVSIARDVYCILAQEFVREPSIRLREYKAGRSIYVEFPGHIAHMQKATHPYGGMHIMLAWPKDGLRYDIVLTNELGLPVYVHALGYERIRRFDDYDAVIAEVRRLAAADCTDA